MIGVELSCCSRRRCGCAGRCSARCRPWSPSLAVTGLAPPPGRGAAFLSAVLTNGSSSRPRRWRSCCRCSCRSRSRSSPGTPSPARRGRHAALPAGPAGRPDPAAGRQAGVDHGVRAARGAARDGDRLPGRRRALRLRARRRAGRRGRGDVAVRRGAQSGGAAGRTALVVGYLALCMLALGAVGLFFSTLTDSPLAAALGVLALVVASAALQPLDAAAALEPLPADAALAGLDRPLPRPDPVAGRARGRRGAGRVRAGRVRGGVGELRDQGRHELNLD